MERVVELYTVCSRECVGTVPQSREESGLDLRAELRVDDRPANDPKGYDSPNGLLAFSPYRWDQNKKINQDSFAKLGDAKAQLNAVTPDENPTLFRYQLPATRRRRPD